MSLKIALVEPVTDLPLTYTLSVAPRLGLPILGSILRARGHEVVIFVEAIARPRIDQLATYDLVGISILTNNALKGYALGDELRRRGVAVVMGGYHATYLPDEALAHCDFVVRGEGERTLPDLVEALEGRRELSSVTGLSYAIDGIRRHNPDRPPDADYLSVSPDFDLIKGLRAFARGFVSRYRFMPPVHASRGCPFYCRYCTVIGLAGRVPRFRPLSACLGDIEKASKLTRKDIGFVDDNFTMDLARTKRMLKLLIALGLPRKYTFTTQIKVDAFRDEELLALLRDANFELLHVGYESVNDSTLREWRKHQSFEQMSSTVEQARRFGLRINGMFVVGSDQDTEETVAETTSFAIETDMATMQIWILTPLPGSDVYRQQAAERRIFNRHWTHYDCQHSVCFPERIRPSALQRAVMKANDRFYKLERLRGAVGNRKTYAWSTYRMRRWMSDYARRLEAIEDSFYDAGNQLLTGKLETFDPAVSTAVLASGRT